VPACRRSDDFLRLDTWLVVGTGRPALPR